MPLVRYSHCSIREGTIYQYSTVQYNAFMHAAQKHLGCILGLRSRYLAALRISHTRHPSFQEGELLGILDEALDISRSLQISLIPGGWTIGNLGWVQSLSVAEVIVVLCAISCSWDQGSLGYDISKFSSAFEERDRNISRLRCNFITVLLPI